MVIGAQRAISELLKYAHNMFYAREKIKVRNFKIVWFSVV